MAVAKARDDGVAVARPQNYCDDDLLQTLHPPQHRQYRTSDRRSFIGGLQIPCAQQLQAAICSGGLSWPLHPFPSDSHSCVRPLLSFGQQPQVAMKLRWLDSWMSAVDDVVGIGATGHRKTESLFLRGELQTKKFLPPHHLLAKAKVFFCMVGSIQKM